MIQSCAAPQVSIEVSQLHSAPPHFVCHHPFSVSPIFSFSGLLVLSHIIQQFKPILVPFHLPSKTPRECAPSSLGSILHNHFDWEKKLAEIPIEQLPCKCKQFERQHPNVDMVDGHVATGLENMSFQDPVLRELAYANSKSLVFPSKAKYAKQASVAFKKWCKTRRCHHGHSSFTSSGTPISDTFVTD